jgi:hypothetical protein
MPNFLASNNTLICRAQLHLVAHRRLCLLCVVVTHLMVVALVDLLTAMVAVLLVVASTTKPRYHLDPVMALRHTHSANCALRLGTLPRHVGTDTKNTPPLSHAILLLLRPSTLTTTGTPTLGLRIT